jgi:hypothetical protein
VFGKCALIWEIAGTPIKAVQGTTYQATVIYDEQEYLSRPVKAIDAWLSRVDGAANTPITRPPCVPVASQSPSARITKVKRMLVEPMGFEPTTSTLQTSRSPN